MTASTAALEALAGGRQLICEVRDVDRYKRLVAECWNLTPGLRREDGPSINARMVSAGWAIAYRKYSTAYAEHEREARAAKRGLWASEFQQPADYRAAARGK